MEKYMNLMWVIFGLVISLVGFLITGLGWNWDKWHKSDKEAPKEVSSISQTMVNSPGSYQVGGNLTIEKELVRLVSKEQEDLIVKSLKADKPSEVYIDIASMDQETMNFAYALQSAMEKGGWTVPQGPVLVHYKTVLPHDLIVSSPLPLTQEAIFMFQVLKKAGLNPASNGDKLPVNNYKVRIIVSSKI